MKLTRRTLLRTAAAAAVAAGLPLRSAWANSVLELGGIRIDMLRDGNLVLPVEFLLAQGMPQDAAAAILQDHGLAGDTLSPDCNITLLRDGSRTVLIDAGSGPNFMPSAGKLPDALDALGVAPQDVTHVVFTHAHPDHLWGVLDDFDDLLFPQADYLIGRVEHDYWRDPATAETIDEGRLSFVAGAQRHLAAIGDRLATFEDGDAVLPGLTARASFGHTPGHMAFEVQNGTEAVMILGDCIGNHHVAFARPDWLSGADQDPQLAATTRIALLDRLAAEQLPFIGFHLPFPGIGRAVQADDGFRFVAA